MEPDAPQLVRKAVRILADNPIHLTPVCLPDTQRQGVGNSVPGQKQNPVPLVLFLAYLQINLPGLLLRDPVHFRQAVWLFFDDVKCLRAEPLHNPVRERFPNPFNQPGG